MKKIFLGIIALLAFVFTAQADKIVSGQKYKILSLDGTKALSCGSNAARDAILTMNAVSDDEVGQVWVFNQNGEYWNVTSNLGAFNIDNPSASHSKFQNQVVLWDSGNGDNHNFVSLCCKPKCQGLPMMIATTWFLAKMLKSATHWTLTANLPSKIKVITPA